MRNLRNMRDPVANENSNHPFHISKWYLDVCDADGNAFIGYAVKVAWRKITVAYRGYILLDSHGNNITMGKVGDACFPTKDENSLEWITPEANGTWNGLLHPIEETVSLPDNHNFHWICSQPLSQVKVSVHDKLVIEGNGYAERIELALAPWKLPISRLYWGRFTSERDSVVWIHWQGEMPLTIVYANGKRFSEISIDENGMRFPGGAVEFHNQKRIRAGKLSETVLKSFAFLKKIFPVKALGIEENKWTCSATFTAIDGKKISGYCIHEIVNFGEQA